MKKQSLLIVTLCLFTVAFYAQEGHVQQPGNGFTAAGLNTGTNTSGSTYFGENAGQNSIGYQNTFIGSESGLRNIDGSKNVLIGERAGAFNISGNYNTFTGALSGYRNKEGSYNTFSGMYSGFNNTTGHNNSLLGFQSGYYNKTGSRNLFLGFRAGFNETRSDKLYIDNSSTSTPLIYGDFLKNELTVNGRLGIGVTNPQYNLEIKGSLKLKNGNTDLLIYRDSDVGDWSLLRTNSGNGIGLIGQPDVIALSISRTSSNVGIGTTNPVEKFQIGNSYTFHDGGHKVIGFMYAPGADLDLTKYAAEVRFDPNSGNLRIGTSSGVNNAPTTRLTIDKNGNTGIGTTNLDSGYKLTVKGNISTREVKVTADAGGADFVFENDYDLPTLKAVEQFITINKHLPEIASAKEMKKNGIHLAEMNIKLLQKIEELTLYAIQQQKELDAQNQKNNALEARLIALEAHLKN